MADDKPRPPEHIQAILDEADRVRAQADLDARRLEKALRRPTVWPDRRRPRRWSAAEYGHDPGNTPTEDR